MRVIGSVDQEKGLLLGRHDRSFQLAADPESGRTAHAGLEGRIDLKPANGDWLPAFDAIAELAIPDSGQGALKRDLALLGVVCGRGRNPTLRLWPAIFSGEIDVFPSERRNMGQEIGR